MCGISGYADFENDVSGEHEVINSMNEMLTHRGPDASGLWLCNEAAIGHRQIGRASCRERV